MSHDRLLQRGALVFGGGFVLHNVDHARRGLEEITEHVVWSGTVVAMMAAAILTLVFTRHPLARAAAAVGGTTIAVGVSASHLLPEWSAFSDSLVDGRVDAVTWVAVLAEIVGAVGMSAAGAAALRRGDRPLRTSEAGSLPDTTGLLYLHCEQCCADHAPSEGIVVEESGNVSQIRNRQLAMER